MQRSTRLMVRAISAVAIIAAAPIAFAPASANAAGEVEVPSCAELVPDKCSFDPDTSCKPQSPCVNGFGEILITYRKPID